MGAAAVNRKAEFIRQLGPEQRAMLTRRSDWRGAWAVFSTWAVIGLTFAMLAIWPNPLTILLALVILGGRQLALAVLAHEAAHRTLFNSLWLNTTFADWSCARPIWNDVGRYREHHLRHHRDTSGPGDPDLTLVKPFPTTRQSLRRKLLRDVSGRTGLRRMLGLLAMDLGFMRYNVAGDVDKLPQQDRRLPDYLRDGLRNLGPVVLTNLLLAGLLAAAGCLWVYGIWLLAYLTTFSLFLRIRSVAEHACTETSSDAFRNTRTTRANWLARATVAPMHVNYHLEHHLMVSVPFYRLPALHKLVNEQAAAPPPTSGYRQVLRIAASA